MGYLGDQRGVPLIVGSATTSITTSIRGVDRTGFSIQVKVQFCCEGLYVGECVFGRYRGGLDLLRRGGGNVIIRVFARDVGIVQ